MSPSTLADHSVLIRLPDRTVHVDPQGRWVHVRVNDPASSTGGSLLASHDFGQVRRVRLMHEGGSIVLRLELLTGRHLPLGHASSVDIAMHTARTVADLCRCQLDAGGGEGPVRAATVAFTEASTFDAPDLGAGVVPLSGPVEPYDTEPITDEHVPAARPRADSLHRVTRELSKAEVDAAREPPVFGALLRESEMAAALDPCALQDALAPPPPADVAEDQKPTLVGLNAVSARAVAELLDLAAERLPVATADVPSRPHARG